MIYSEDDEESGWRARAVHYEWSMSVEDCDNVITVDNDNWWLGQWTWRTDDNEEWIDENSGWW